MGLASRKLRSMAGYDHAPAGYMHWCPGCEGFHAVYVEQPNPVTGARWTFDGNLDSPTFAPSVLVFTSESGERKTLCHYFIRSGMIEFCGDSPHALSGKTVPLPDVPGWIDK